MLGPWAIKRPLHGGQIRAASIAAAYRARGHQVLFMGIYDPGNVPPCDTSRDDVAIESRAMEYVGNSGVSWEVSLWDAFAEVPDLFARFRDAVQLFRPNIVQFEEPYLWPVVRALRQRGFLAAARVVHSSYNYETEYRSELAEIAGNVDRSVLDHVRRQEAEIARASDAVFVVSDSDADNFRRLGAQRVVVARNGGQRPEPNEEAQAALDAYIGETKYAIFVSSAHPPNAQGLLDFIEAPCRVLPGVLMIAGSVCQLLEPHRRAHPLIRDARMLGVVDKPILEALLSRATVMLLPKTRGGGSNLKTAEALLTGHTVVATSSAFTGFEPWRDQPGVMIADDPALFWESVSAGLTAVSGSWDRNCDDLLWPACLEPMVAMVEALAREPGAIRPGV